MKHVEIGSECGCIGIGWSIPEGGAPDRPTEPARSRGKSGLDSRDGAAKWLVRPLG